MLAPANIYYRIKVILTQDGVRELFVHILAINIISSVALLAMAYLIDFASLYRQFSVMTMAQYQSINIFGSLLIEVLITLATIFRWMYKRHFSNASTERMIAEGENEQLELKSSLRWDFKTHQVNKELEHTIVKSVAGFMNARGGTLIIGVDDAKRVIGLMEDIQTMRKKDEDGFLLHLGQLIGNMLGNGHSAFVSARIVRLPTASVCRVDVLPARTPAYVSYNGRQEFFVRIAAATQELQVKEAHEYINLRWEK